MGKMRVRVAGVLAGVVSMSAAARAITIADFKPLPASPTIAFPEFQFGGGPTPSFQTGLGSIGNADGTLPLVNQTPGGLIVETPFIIGGIAGSQFTANTTIFFDCTLTFTGLLASAPATSAGGVLSQPLGSGTFVLYSTDPDGAGPLLPTDLLTGNITTSSFIVGVGDSAGEFNAGGITYTGGAILAPMLAGGSNAAGNSMSVSMVDVTPSLSIGGNGFLSDFVANGTGLFSASVPEPTSLALFGLGVLGTRGRRSKR